MKKIPLTQGKFALVDDCDYDALNKYKWCFATVGYAVRNLRASESASRGVVYMHRVILGAKKKQEVDHINFDKLDNRRCNIRVASSRQNKCNKPPASNNTSGFKGVSWAKRERRWVAYINIAVGQRKVLGYFREKGEARAAYCSAAKQHYGEFAYV